MAKKSQKGEGKLKILLVEDDLFLVSMYSTKFEMLNYEVVSATNGEDGLKKAKECAPHIILLDILLPAMNGFDVLQKLKSESSTKEIPVILLTNLNQKDELDKGRKLGADDYLIKAHYLPSEVVDKIEEVLRRRKIIK